MKYFLSSYKFGKHVDDFLKMIPKNNKKIALIPNAGDAYNPVKKKEKDEKSLKELKKLNLDAEVLDLRNYFDKKEKLEKDLSKYGSVWVKGGNVYVLMQAMKFSGFDKIIKKFSKRKDFLYAGYSAGSAVLAENLEGIHIIDDLSANPYGERLKAKTKGVGLINYLIIPHYKSDHHESADADKAVEYMQQKKLPYKTLRDGDVIII